MPTEICDMIHVTPGPDGAGEQTPCTNPAVARETKTKLCARCADQSASEGFAVIEIATGQPWRAPTEPGLAVCVLVDYHAGDHRPYLAMLHSLLDVQLDQAEDGTPLLEAIEKSGAVDGDEIEILVRRTGNRPFGDRKYVFVGKHVYQREP